MDRDRSARLLPASDVHARASRGSGRDPSLSDSQVLPAHRNQPMMRATAMSPKKSGLLTTEAILTLPFDARFTSARRSVDFFSSGAALGDSLRFASVVCRRLARAATAFFAARLLSFSRAFRSPSRAALRAGFLA